MKKFTEKVARIATVILAVFIIVIVYAYSVTTGNATILNYLKVLWNVLGKIGTLCLIGIGYRLFKLEKPKNIKNFLYLLTDITCLQIIWQDYKEISKVWGFAFKDKAFYFSLAILALFDLAGLAFVCPMLFTFIVIAMEIAGIVYIIKDIRRMFFANVRA